MAQFRVGQRVKALTTTAQPWEAEGVLLAFHGEMTTEDGSGPGWLVDLPGHIGPLGHSRWLVLESHLVPLTDPGADAFMERIRKIKPEPAMVPLAVTEKH